MPTHVALLRGINVGGRNRLAMADLRSTAESIGWTDVATYVQSGNLVFAASAPNGSDLEAALENRLGVRCAVVVLSRAELAGVVDANPWPDEADGTHLHVIFSAEAADPNAVADALTRAAGGDDARIVGGTLYLHTPNGIGRSKLAEVVMRKGPPDGTARNWNTVARLLGMLMRPAAAPMGPYLVDVSNVEEALEVTEGRDHR